MLKIKIIATGLLSEKYFKEACDEYKKRMSAHTKITVTELKEKKLSKNPSENEIKACLDSEAEKIFEEIPPKSTVVSLCVEGKLLSSEELSDFIDKKAVEGTSEICFIIGSSYGLSEKIKNISDLKISLSRLTFPHQLARVILFEALYRAGEIRRGTKYHK